MVSIFYIVKTSTIAGQGNLLGGFEMAVRRKESKAKRNNNKRRYVWTIVVAHKDDADNGVHIVCDTDKEFETVVKNLRNLDRFDAFETLDKEFGLTK